MINIIDFSEYEQKFERTYGGASCRKYDIEYQNEKWFLKFPGNIREQVEGMSYSNASVSEYIGSHIYKMLGIDVHETMLGIFEKKCVVACKDFVKDDEFPVTGFGEFKTTFAPRFTDSNGNETNGNGTDLEETIQTLEEHPLLKKTEGLKERFWDMFVVDSLIGNNDRNNGNWGLIKNIHGTYRISPVFDNGAAFVPKTPENKMVRILKDKAILENLAYKGYFCIFEIHGHRINPFKYMQTTENKDCLSAVNRIVPRIDIAKIKDLIEEIPSEYKGVIVMSDLAKELYVKLLEERYKEILLPLYKKLAEPDIAKKISKKAPEKGMRL